MKTAIKPTAPSFADVNVGDYVWIDSLGYDTLVHSHIAKITHISASGRLFICMPTVDMLSNHRYGFHPETGKAQYHGYRNMTMRYAAPAEVEAELAKIAAKDDEELAARRQSARDEIIRRAAPKLLAACKAARVHLVDLGDQLGLVGVATFELLSAAIAEAEKEIA